MENSPESFEPQRSPEEIEARNLRIKELYKQHDVLTVEIDNILREEATLINALGDNNASMDRLERLSKRQNEIVRQWGEIEREIAALQ